MGLSGDTKNQSGGPELSFLSSVAFLNSIRRNKNFFFGAGDGEGEEKRREREKGDQ